MPIRPHFVAVNPKSPEHSIYKRNVQRYVDECTKVMEIQKKVCLNLASDEASVWCADGNTKLPFPAYVTITPWLPFQTLSFIIKHELAHIKNDDMLTMPLASLTTFFISYIALSILIPTLTISSMLLATIIGVGTLILVSKRCEEQADKTAIRYSSEEEIQSILDFFEKIKIKYQEIRESSDSSQLMNLINKILISPEGDDRLDVLHPSFSTRCKYMREALERIREEKRVASCNIGS